MNYTGNRITIAAILLLVLCTLLVFGRQQAFRFAGGSGVDEVVRATVNGEVLRRGERVKTDSFTELSIGTSQLFLDQQTEIELISLSKQQPIVRVIQGRVVASGEIGIQVRETLTETYGSLSYTHYSWLDRIEIGVLSGYADFTTPASSRRLTNDGIESETLPPYAVKEIPFTPETSSAKAFYQWVASSNPLLSESLSSSP